MNLSNERNNELLNVIKEGKHQSEEGKTYVKT